MSEKEQVLWLCSRCAKRTGKKRELEPTVLRVCSVCHVENWVRPFGHAGSDVASPEVEDKAQKAWDEADFLAEHKEEEVAESTPEETKETIEGEDRSKVKKASYIKKESKPKEESEQPEQSAKEKEIARLKAELESLEG